MLMDYGRGMAIILKASRWGFVYGEDEHGPKEHIGILVNTLWPGIQSIWVL